jgi:hypothetical protein
MAGKGKGKVPGGHSLPKRPKTGLKTATRGNAKPANDTPDVGGTPRQPSIFGRRG